MLTKVTYYRIPRDPDDGRPTHLYDRLFELALRWRSENIDIPDEYVSGASKRRGEPPVHAGTVALHLLREGNDISTRQLDAAFDFLHRAIAYYRSEPEPYLGRNAEAIHDLSELRAELSAGEAIQL